MQLPRTDRQEKLQTIPFSVLSSSAQSMVQDFNFFLDQQPVSVSASNRLLAEPEKRKRGASSIC